jgi:hypothetical protein
MNIFKSFVGGDDAVTSALKKVRLPREEYIELMRDLIGVVSKLQNSPLEGIIPNEDLAGDILLKKLMPYSTEQGGAVFLIFLLHAVVNAAKDSGALVAVGFDPFLIDIVAASLFRRSPRD